MERGIRSLARQDVPGILARTTLAHLHVASLEQALLEILNCLRENGNMEGPRDPVHITIQYVIQANDPERDQIIKILNEAIPQIQNKVDAKRADLAANM